MVDLKREHEAAARTLRFALTLDNSEAYGKLANVFAAVLTPKERGGIMYAAALHIDPDVIAQILDAVAIAHGADHSGPPLPSLTDPIDEARTWVQYASSSEIDIYAAACICAMSDERRKELLQTIQGMIGAA